MDYNKENTKELEERVVSINRCSKAQKGGRSFSFSALVVAGDHEGTVGLGFAKANEVSDAIRKAAAAAHANTFNVPLHDKTIPHDVISKHGGAQVIIRPASPGTGLIAGGAMRALLELGGVRDALAKSMGSNNALNVSKATEAGMKSLKSRDYILEKRSLKN